MDIVVVFQRVCRVVIRRLLLIIGMVVAVVVYYQCFALPYGKSFSPSIVADKGLGATMVGNATFKDDTESTAIYVSVANDEETKGTETDYDFGLYEENFFVNSFQENKDENSQKKSVINDNVGYVTDRGNGPTETKGTDDNVEYVSDRGNGSTETKVIEGEQGQQQNDGKMKKGYEIDHDQIAVNGLTLGRAQYKPGISYVLPVRISRRDVEPENMNTNSYTSEPFTTANLSSINSVKPAELPRVVSIIPHKNLTTADISMLRRLPKHSTSISQMNSLLLESRVSSHLGRPRWSSVRDRELLSAKQEIETAPVSRNTPGLNASIFRNASTFKRSYELMEHMLKVYIYKEGEKPIYHQPKMRGIYASEGWFMKLIEGNKNFIARDPRKAHLFYLPFSAQMLRAALFGQTFRSQKDLQNHLKYYVELIAGKYRFWNRTGGADHFLVACHDWAPLLTRQLMKNCIRVLCNANVAKGFKIGMDTTLPVTYIRSVEAPLKELGGRSPKERSILAFFAGSMHGYLRPILLKFWENKEADMKVFGPMPRDIEGKRIYREYMKSSKYCICARGYEVHTPRVVEAIFYECVPVIIADNYVPPFFEVLNWETFSVFVQEKEIPNLRNILLSIPEERYLVMQSRVKAVQKHFLWHKKPKKYDLFHMILHSIWYNRVFNVKTK